MKIKCTFYHQNLFNKKKPAAVSKFLASVLDILTSLSKIFISSASTLSVSFEEPKSFAVASNLKILLKALYVKLKTF